MSLVRYKSAWASGLARAPVSLWFHLAVVVHHLALALGFVSIDLEQFTDPTVLAIKPYKFFTVSGWCFELQFLHAMLALSVEWQHCRERPDHAVVKRNTYWKDVLFRGLVLPSTLLVCTLFWSLFLYDRELVFPALWDAVVTPRLNHGVHSVTLLCACAEALLRRSPGNRALEQRLCWCMGLGYPLLLNLIYLLSGTWLYPVLGRLGWARLLAAQAACAAAGHGLLRAARRWDGLR